MSERERRLLILRYGLDDGVSRTLGETATFFGITRERVRQIEVEAIRKLRVLMAGDESLAPIRHRQYTPSANQPVRAKQKRAAHRQPSS